MTPILSPEDLTELEALKKRLRFDTRSRQAGNHVSSRRGSSAEFLEHRAYAEGDDLRRLDWAVYARTGEPSIKLFRAEEDTCVRIFLDTSASLLQGSPAKFEIARRAAAALGYMTLASSERAQVLSGAAALAPPTKAARGRGGVARFMHELTSVTARGAGDLAACLQTARRSVREKSVVAVFSDFFDPGPVLETLSQLAADGHTLVVVQVLSHEDASPTLFGDYTLVDSETGHEVALTVDSASLDAYAQRLRALFESLQGIALRSRGRVVRLIGDERPSHVVDRILSARYTGA